MEHFEQTHASRQDHPALVSVIIPAYNADTYIRQTLESVLAQTYQSFEVIVVDDGSSDDTIRIVEKFVQKDARFQLLQQINAGVGAARNNGIRKARGKYIAPLDADDLWFPEKLAKQVARMEEVGSGTGLVYSWCEFINEHGECIGKSRPWRVEGRLRHAMVLNSICDSASNPLFRASALEKVGLYLTRAEQGGAQGCEDYDLFLRIGEAYNIHLVPEVLMGYRHTHSGMSVNPTGMEASFGIFLKRARQRNPDLPPDAFRWSAGFFYQFILGKCFAWGNYKGCLRYIVKAVRANPVLFLHLWIYQKFLQSLIKIVTRSTGTKGTRSYAEKKPPRFNLNTIFKRIQAQRWAVAVRDQR